MDTFVLTNAPRCGSPNRLLSDPWTLAGLPMGHGHGGCLTATLPMSQPMRMNPWTLPAALVAVSLLTAGLGLSADAVRAVTTPGGSASDWPAAVASDPPEPTHQPAATPTPTPSRSPSPSASPAPPSTASLTPSANATAKVSATMPAAAGIVAPSGGAAPGPAGLGVPESGSTILLLVVGLPIMLGLVAVALFVTVARRRHARGREVPAPTTSLPARAWRTGTIVQLPVATASTGPAPQGGVANLPRWLDPSVTAARFRTDTTTAARAAAAMAAVASPRARPAVVFSDAIAEPTRRQLVRYDGVPLLDRPDDALGRAQRELDGGDEVEILERQDIWAHVRTPEGAQGWVPNMTLSAAATAPNQGHLEAPDTTESDQTAPPDEPPTLEALLEAIAAQRLTRQQPESEMALPAPPKRRSRKPKSDGLAAPASSEGPADGKAATAPTKRSRSRKPRSDRRAASR